MIQIGISIAVVLSLINLVVLILIFKRFGSTETGGVDSNREDELRSLREEISRSEREGRSEVRSTQEAAAKTLAVNLGELSKTLTAQLEGVRTTFDERFQSLQQGNENKLDQISRTVTDHLQTTSDTLVATVGELGKAQKSATDTLGTTIGELGEAQTRQLANGTKAINDLIQTNKSSIEGVRTIVDKRLQDMQTSNERKLDQIRQTVDEQLQSTLEKRLGESFNIVSKRLEEVQRGLGEMQNLAIGVGDLKRVLTNVKTRGTWGEVQLGALLEEILTPDQYKANVKLQENSQDVVEYAIRLPGNDEDPDSCVWLPIDSKFPLADYERLVDAADTSDVGAVEEAAQALVRSVQSEAKKIREKYIAPPKTTDFAIMFLPTEGLYAEVLRAPGQVTDLLQNHRIVVAGPTTLAAILSSLRMGFRTLAIEKRSSEVWDVLAAVKTEFGKFGGVMDKLKRQLNTASKTIDETGVRTRAMERKLRTVEELPREEADVHLGFSDGMPIIGDD